MITVFALDGIGGHGGPNAMGQNMIRPLVESGGYDWQDVPYLASIGPANPENNVFNDVWLRKSDRDGARQAAKAIHATDNLAAIVGYSGGASATSLLMEDMQRGEPYTRGLEVVWAVTIANPRRHRGPDAPGYGIAGEHTDFPRNITHFEVANPDDAIPCCPQYSPLRTLTDAGQDGPNPQAWLRMAIEQSWQVVIPQVPDEFSDPRFWLRPDALEKARLFAWLKAEAIATRDGWHSAGRMLVGYLDGTAHGSDYVTRRLFDEPVRQILAREWE